MKYLMALFLAVFTAHIAVASPDWKLKKENDNIKVYTADVASSGFKSVKVECTVAARPSQIVAVLLDLDRHPQWVFNNKYSKMLKQVDSSELIYYSEVDVPWPCTNRDYISHLKVTQPSANTVLVDSHAEPDYLPQKNGIVRVKSSVAHWRLTTEGSNTKIEYTIQFDPSGSVPAWLTNMFVTKGPYETFEKLKARMNLPEYQHARYSFLSN